MLEYNADEKLLKVFRKGVKEIPCEAFSLTKRSYDKFVKVDLEKNIRDLEQYIQENIVPDAGVRFTNIRTVTTTLDDPREEKTLVRHRLKVYVDIEANGSLTRDVEVLDMPGLDDDGTYNGNVIVNELVKSEGLSFDAVKNRLLLVLPRSQYSFGTNKTSLYLEGYRSRKLSICDLLVASSILLGGVSPDISKDLVLEDFTNSIIITHMGKAQVKVPLLSIDAADKFAETSGGFVNYINSERQSLGLARQVINKRLSLSKCLGKTLSRDAVINVPELGRMVLSKGTVLNTEHIRLLKLSACNKVYIRYIPAVVGFKLGQSIFIKQIPKGTKVTPLIVDSVPEMEDYAYVPEDMDVSVTLHADTLITEDAIRLLYDAGVQSFKIKNNPLHYTFEHEVISNNTIEVRDLFPDGVPDSVKAFYSPYDAIYVPAYQKYNNDMTVLTTSAFKNQLVPDKLNVDDIKSLVNFYCGVKTLPEMFKAFNRDTDFLKKVATPDITLARMLEDTCKRFTRNYRQAIKNAMTGQSAKIRETMYCYGKCFHEVFVSKEYGRLVKTAEYVNPVSLISQPLRLVVGVSARQASSGMRNIVMGHYGRLCTYDTPVGNTIGLASSLTSAARIDENGNLSTPYHPIVKRDGEYYISEEIKWLTTEEEMSYRIGDIIDVQHIRPLKQPSDTWNVPLKNTYSTARVPASIDDVDNVTAETVETFDLDFVNVVPEQAISPVAQLIPFLGANDGVRVSYTISMLKQAVYVQGAELPLVKTQMGNEFLAGNDTYVLRSDRDAEIVDITPTAIITTEGDIPYKDVKVTKMSFTSFDFKKKIGDEIRKGDIIADTVVSKNGEVTLGSNLLTGYIPYYGFNNDDGYVMSDGGASKFVSHSISNVSMDLKRGGGIVADFDVGLTTYVGEGEPIFRWNEINRRLQTTTRKTYITRKGQSGVVYRVTPHYDIKTGKESREATLIDFDEVTHGDKFAGYHGNKGTVALRQKDSLMPCFNNGVVFEMLSNICGVPSRMNMGQVLEAPLGFCAYMLGIRTQSNSMNGATLEDIEELMQFVWELCNKDYDLTMRKWSSVYPAAMMEHVRTRKQFMREWKGCFYPDGTAPVFNQLTGKYFDQPMMFGISTYIKLHHQVEDKITARAGGDNYNYNLIDKQPTQGRAREGGQRFGEMEMFVLQAYGCTELIEETLNAKSDNLVYREELQRIQSPSTFTYGWDPNVTLAGNSTKGSEILRYYGEALHLKMDFVGGSDISLHGIETRRSRHDIDMLEMSKATKDKAKISTILKDLEDLG